MSVKNNKVKISVIIIARNEEKRIGDCLKSVAWADEVLVILDKKSADGTEKIAKECGARVIKSGKAGYTPNRNFGLKKAKGEWVLYVDADERVTPKLRNEISELISNFQFPISSDRKENVAYAIPRKNIVLGRELTHGGFGKFDYVKRLFVKDKLVKWTGEIHEEPNFWYRGKLTTGKETEVGHLKNKLVHIKAQTLSEMVEKTNEWSEVEAKLMYNAHHPPMNILRFFSAMFREFWFRMIKKKAFLDGPIGIIHAFYQVFSRFISYAKLWELQIQNSAIKK